jgi:hypothetical protein
MDDIQKVSHCISPLSSWSESINILKTDGSESFMDVPSISSGKQILKE